MFSSKHTQNQSMKRSFTLIIKSFYNKHQFNIGNTNKKKSKTVKVSAPPAGSSHDAQTAGGRGHGLDSSSSSPSEWVPSGTDYRNMINNYSNNQ